MAQATIHPFLVAVPDGAKVNGLLQTHAIAMLNATPMGIAAKTDCKNVGTCY
jgi:hypothetical protein